MEIITEFDFTKTEEVYNYSITPNIILCIKRYNHGVSILYFTDEFSNKINVPNEIVVYEYNVEDKNKKLVLYNKEKERYSLCWADNYVIEFNKIVLLEIKNQRKWNIIENIKN